MSFARPLSRALPSALPSPLTGGGAALGPLLSGLVAYWDLGESSGNRADSGSSGYTLTDNNTVGSAVGVGAGQTAASFASANSEYLSRAGGPPFGSETDSWHFVVWAYITDTTFSYPVANGQSGTSGAAAGWQLFDFGDGRVFFQARNAADSGQISAVVAGVTRSVWTLLEFGYDADSEQMFLATNAGAKAEVAAAGGLTIGASAQLNLGARNAGSFIDGRLQSAGIWSRLLTADERTWLYNSGTAARLYSDVEAYTG